MLKKLSIGLMENKMNKLMKEYKCDKVTCSLTGLNVRLKVKNIHPSEKMIKQLMKIAVDNISSIKDHRTYDYTLELYRDDKKVDEITGQLSGKEIIKASKYVL